MRDEYLLVHIYRVEVGKWRVDVAGGQIKDVRFMNEPFFKGLTDKEKKYSFHRKMEAWELAPLEVAFSVWAVARSSIGE